MSAADQGRAGGFDSDRQVHAFGDAGEVVRYQRAGKWYFEPKDGKRSPLTITAAVQMAVWLWDHDNGSVNFGRSGGTSFDRKVRARV